LVKPGSSAPRPVLARCPPPVSSARLPSDVPFSVAKSRSIQTKEGTGVPMSKGTAIVSILIALVVGTFIGRTYAPSSGEGGSAAALPENNVERFKTPAGTSPVRGPEHARVTIMEWSDYQCPFCSRVEPTLEQITQKYGKDVRII